ncbi:hypothetical protein AVEN_29450-1 [Araneus ventricosus]|uniref:Uncharacterized protein n=1 Tax=Araneus ventricosus TaxID=182803 RepID=A0A4Y2KB01_ARAVE|nr:hypothetical protein AVEN_29450-1 [Araneus ventricosus]
MDECVGVGNKYTISKVSTNLLLNSSHRSSTNSSENVIITEISNTPSETREAFDNFCINFNSRKHMNWRSKQWDTCCKVQMRELLPSKTTSSRILRTLLTSNYCNKRMEKL